MVKMAFQLCANVMACGNEPFPLKLGKFSSLFFLEVLGLICKFTCVEINAVNYFLLTQRQDCQKANYFLRITHPSSKRTHL